MNDQQKEIFCRIVAICNGIVGMFLSFGVSAGAVIFMGVTKAYFFSVLYILVGIVFLVVLIFSVWFLLEIKKNKKGIYMGFMIVACTGCVLCLGMEVLLVVKSIWVLQILLILMILLSILNVSAFLMRYLKKELVEEIHEIIIGLKGVYGEYDKYEFPMVPDEKIFLGRDKERCQILFKDQHIARLHCMVRFRMDKQKYEIRDFSTNGTFWMDGKRLEKGRKYQCKPGKCFVVGRDHVFQLI